MTFSLLITAVSIYIRYGFSVEASWRKNFYLIYLFITKSNPAYIKLQYSAPR